MRLIKMFGLATAVAALAMAFVGASSALATGSSALCKENKLVCPAGQIYTGHIEGLSTNAILKGTFFGIAGTILCKHSVILGNALGLAKPQVTHLELLDFFECHDSFSNSCIVETLKPLGLVDLLKTAPNLGTATSLNNLVNVVCSGFPGINCEFGGEPVLHAIGTEGAKPAELSAKEAVLTASGSVCPSNPRWTALYEIVLPKPIFISE